MRFFQTRMSAISFLIFIVPSITFSSPTTNARNLTKSSEVLFFDGFEESISNDAVFSNWTTENLEGWHYWHIVPGQYMRFENTDLKQNDWLITKQITSENIENILINFDISYSGSGNHPKLFYTNQYDGNTSESTWTEINYKLGDNEKEWNNTGDIIIENPGNTLYFAFQYEAEANAGIYFLLDNFKATTYTPPQQFTKVGSSSHFEFYTNISGEENYYTETHTSLEKEYKKLSALWNRPGIQNIFNEDDTIKIYFTEPQDFSNKKPGLPTWKSGFHDLNNLEIYITPLSKTNQENYYGTIQNLAINEFSQLAICKKYRRENSNYFPPHFTEGFGLYESGFRPRRDSIIKYMNVNQAPDFEFIRDTSGISNTLKRDLIISNIEGQILAGWSYLGVNPGASTYINGQWPNHLKYYYTEPEDKRLKLRKSTPNFNFYGTESDSDHFSEVVSTFENAYSFYIEKYKFIPDHKFNIVLCPTENIGMKLLNYNDYFNGGAGCGGDLVVQLSPNYNFNQQAYDKYYAGLSAHEFFHIYYNHFMWEIPGGFWAEGSADFSARNSLGDDIRRDRFWMIDWTFNEYALKYHIELNLEHISSNPNQELDIYYLGDMFFEYLSLNHGGYEKIMEFFNKQMDYSVFNATYDEIDTGYINYLKSFIDVNDANKIENRNNLSIKNDDGILQIRNNSNAHQIGKIQIHNLLGSIIFEQELNILPQEQMQLKDLNNLKGLSIVTIKTKNYHFSEKVLFQL